jgi:hypothetical protein
MKRIDGHSFNEEKGNEYEKDKGKGYIYEMKKNELE